MSQVKPSEIMQALKNMPVVETKVNLGVMLAAFMTLTGQSDNEKSRQAAIGAVKAIPVILNSKSRAFREVCMQKMFTELDVLNVKNRETFPFLGALFWVILAASSNSDEAKEFFLSDRVFVDCNFHETLQSLVETPVMQ